MKKIVIASIIVCVTIVFAGCASPYDQLDQPIKYTTKTESVEVVPELKASASPDPKPVEPEPVFDWSRAEVTEENVRLALENNVGAAMAIPMKDETFRRFTSSEDLEGQYIQSIRVHIGTKKVSLKEPAGRLSHIPKYYLIIRMYMKFRSK
ncbi:hypothetical protein [Paenibacillus glucanolyticus]|uniref:hypothetical protein n=1 Tax=Paenibacillus glucanolyticus TaxID=59843 RepID=UPI00096E145F|nr:hypothetical protein [Paenibacillus glucanolyticus]OMF70873.1 hypothetical protein BK142_23430 [Paenibacillus glucanolyticus]